MCKLEYNFETYDEELLNMSSWRAESNRIILIDLIQYHQKTL